MELLERAYEVQMRALELVWMIQGGTGPAAPTAPAPPAPPTPPERHWHRTAPQVEADVHGIFHALPGRFSRRDVCGALGYEPDRGALYKILQALVLEGRVEVEATGKGQRGTLYRKTGP